MNPTTRRALVAAATTVLATSVLASPAGAGLTVRTKGDGTRVNISWTEYDPDNLIGAPGNVHVGHLYAENGPYGNYLFGNVTDFECAPGQSPFFGHHVVVDEGADVAAEATGDAIEAIVDSGQTSIDAEFVKDVVGTELNSEIPDEIIDESAGCKWLGHRFLEGDTNIVMTVNAQARTATVKGNLVVSTGGHGEPGNVLGRPPVNITITGGDWQQWEFAYSFRGEGYRYSDSQKGTDWNGGTVTGAIGVMNFADDADDESFGSFGSYSFRTVERVR